jgi:hypothetical protein
MAAYSKEQLERLCSLPTIGDYYSRYRNALENGTLADFFRAEFLHLKTDYSDETPSEDVRDKSDANIRHAIRTNSPIPSTLQYKCQTSFFIAFGAEFEEAVESETITDQVLIEDVQAFRESIPNGGLTIGAPENPAIIAGMNDILDRLITHLSPTEPIKQSSQASSLHR